MASRRRSATSASEKKDNAVKPAKQASVKARGSHIARPKRGIKVISSKLSYDGPLFKVFTDEVLENGKAGRRDVVRHNGTTVILALDDTQSKSDPLVVLERQYRHAAKEYLLEVPAGKLEKGEDPLKGAKRELMEETGFRAKRWRKLVYYFASPGFLGESMQVFVAEGLTAGATKPDEDEQIEVELVPLSEVLRRIEQGKIHDGKTLISVMLYDRLRCIGSETQVRKKK